MTKLEPTRTSSDLTATERLRELLDERGVEYDKAATVIGETVATFWHDRDGYPCSAIEGADDIPDGEVSVRMCITPAQAIAATLGDADATPTRQGDGTCHNTSKVMDEIAVEHRQQIDQLQAENAKLRELLASTISNYADGYMDGTSARYPCDLCDESSMQQCDYQHDRQCPFYRQLRELGVEVES